MPLLENPTLRFRMSSFRIRPRFTQTVEFSLAETRERILRSFASHSPAYDIKSFPEFIGVHYGDNERRYWSPRLFLSLKSTMENTTLVEGIYGPECEVWSIFVYGYLLTGMLGIFSGILGFAQRHIDSYPWGLWVCGAMIVLAVLLYLFAQLGQKLGAWQTFQLHQVYQAAVGQPAEIT